MTGLIASIIEKSRRDREDWRYTDVEKLFKSLCKPTTTALANREAQSLLPKAEQVSRFVFVDGVWSKDESSLGLFASVFLKGDAEKGYLMSCVEESCLVTAPIELVFKNKSVNESKVMLDIVLGPSSSATVVEHHFAENAEASANFLSINIQLGSQAKLLHQKIVHNLHSVAHFAQTNVKVAAGAYYSHFSLLMNSKLLRNEIDVTLVGSLAQCGLHGALLLRDHEHIEVVTRVHHAAPYGISRQLFKSILRDQSRGVFQGCIKVAEGAQKTDGKQLCRALLLSDQAEMDAKPELEIYADDVACSHGCAVGDLDKDAMFYLRSRGLSENDARSLLLEAFIGEVVDEIQSDQVHEYVRGLAGVWMHE